MSPSQPDQGGGRHGLREERARRVEQDHAMRATAAGGETEQLRFHLQGPMDGDVYGEPGRCAMTSPRPPPTRHEGPTTTHAPRGSSQEVRTRPPRAGPRGTTRTRATGEPCTEEMWRMSAAVHRMVLMRTAPNRPREAPGGSRAPTHRVHVHWSKTSGCAPRPAGRSCWPGAWPREFWTATHQSRA